jgi:hypothetical protein
MDYSMLRNTKKAIFPNTAQAVIRPLPIPLKNTNDLASSFLGASH